VEQWSAWYSKYLDRTVFHTSGFMFSGREAGSQQYREWFRKGQFTYVGRVCRTSTMKAREVRNSSLSGFCQGQGIDYPSAYRQVSPNMEASFKSVSKYDKEQPLLDHRAWVMSGEWTKRHFRCMAGSRVQTLMEVLGEMDKATSCGYPWSLKFKNKRDFLENGNGEMVLDTYWEELALSENEMAPIWTCSQKRELRSTEKIAENRLRTFLASPFEHSSALNRMCLDQNNLFYDHANDGIWSVVGATKFLGGWNKLYHRLSSPRNNSTRGHERNAFELDESEYDSSLFVQALLGQRDIRWSMLDPDDRTPNNWIRMEKLYDAVVHSVIVLENGELVQKHTGNPSGSSNTIVDNTMILYRLFAYALILLAQEQQREPSQEDFETQVEAALCGDDNTFTCSDEVVGWFNPPNISRIWTSIGVTTKTPCETPRPLHETSFLSNGFVYDAKMSMWMPVPEAERVLCSLAWGSDIDDVRWHYLRACALRLDSYYNPTCRRVLEKYLSYLNQQHGEELRGVVERETGDMTWETIKTNWKSDAWIEALYCGEEATTDHRSSAEKAPRLGF